MEKAHRFPGVSEEVRMLVDADMDFVDARRRAREAFKDVQLSIDHMLFKVYILQSAVFVFLSIFNLQSSCDWKKQKSS